MSLQSKDFSIAYFQYAKKKMNFRNLGFVQDNLNFFFKIPDFIRYHLMKLMA